MCELLQDAINTRISRNAEYQEPVFGGAYIQHGHVMRALFPSGIVLATPSDQSRYQILNTIVSKLIRYANNFENGGHDDSAKDNSVYFAMLRELDELQKGKQ